MNDFFREAHEELDRAAALHRPRFVSVHEGYAVLLEELDEIWKEIKKKECDHAKLRVECVQLAAMAGKLAAFCDVEVVLKGP